MEYITHIKYNGKNINGEDVLIEQGERLELRCNVLYYDNKPVCIHRSLIGKMYFAKNDDGLGLERGKLTYAIAYSPRVKYSGVSGVCQQRFTDEEIAILRQDWSQYLKPNLDVLLFNDRFFEEKPDVLRQIAMSVNIS